MEQSVQLIVSKIEELIVATGGKVQIFYPYVVKQQIIYGLVILGELIISIILLSVGLKIGTKCKWEGESLFRIWLRSWLSTVAGHLIPGSLYCSSVSGSRGLVCQIEPFRHLSKRKTL